MDNHESDRFQRKNAYLHRLLARACERITSNDLTLDAELAKFYNNYLEEKTRRAEINRKLLEEKVVRAAALRKLTKYEREVLGIDTEPIS